MMNQRNAMFHLRSLAYRLKDNLEPATGGSAPLLSRLSEALGAPRVWARTRDCHAGATELQARAQRQGVGRSYVDDVTLKLGPQRMQLTVTRWVQDEKKSYCGGSWHFQEDLRTGSFRCGFQRQVS